MLALSGRGDSVGRSRRREKGKKNKINKEKSRLIFGV